MRRAPDQVLARARVLGLLSIVEDGMYMDVIPGLIKDFVLDPSLTAQERVWFAGEGGDLSVEDGYQIEAMLVMAWSLGLMASLGDRDPDAYGPVLNLLHGVEGGLPEKVLVERPEAELRAMLAELDEVAARGDGPPPNQRFGKETLRWRRAALRWILDPELAWPAEAGPG